MHQHHHLENHKRGEKKTRKTDNHYAMFGNTAHFRVLSVLHTISSSKQIPVQKGRRRGKEEWKEGILFSSFSCSISPGKTQIDPQIR